MLRDPDRDEYSKAMEKKVYSLFNKYISEMVPKYDMYIHYDKERKLGKNIVTVDKTDLVYQIKVSS